MIDLQRRRTKLKCRVAGGGAAATAAAASADAAAANEKGWSQVGRMALPHLWALMMSEAEDGAAAADEPLPQPATGGTPAGFPSAAAT